MMSDTTILCLDDDPHILNSLRRSLRKEDYHVLTADNVSRGLELLREHHIQLVLSDQRMPEMSGVEFLQRVKEISSDTVRVILSGYADVGLIVDSINKGEVFRFLTKPWNDEELRSAIRQCLSHYDIVRQNRSLHDQIRAQNRQLLQLNVGMEEIVQMRTRSLELAQEVLENFPLAVLGISREGMIMLANRAAEQFVGSLQRLAPGTDMRELLPAQVWQAVAMRLQGEDEPSSISVEWEGREILLQITSLVNNGTIRGCMVIMEEAGIPANTGNSASETICR